MVTSNSMISMADGTWKFVNEINVGEYVISYGSKSNLMLNPQKNKNSNGNRPIKKGKIIEILKLENLCIYNVKTRNRMLSVSGKTLITKVITIKDIAGRLINILKWCRINEIRSGDIIAVLKSHIPFKKSNGGFNFTKEIGQTASREEFMLFAGFYIGDGYSRIRPGEGGEVSLYTFNPPDEEKYSKILDSLFGLKATRVKNESGEYLRVCNLKLAQNLQKWGLTGYAQTKRVPKWIYQIPGNLQISFLKGIVESDGHERRGEWGIELANELLIRDIYILATHLGYPVSNITYRERIANLNGRKIRSNCWGTSIYYNSKKEGAEIRGIKMTPEDLRYERVFSVEKLEDQETHQINILGYHNCFVNGVLIHDASGDHYSKLNHYNSRLNKRIKLSNSLVQV